MLIKSTYVNNLDCLHYCLILSPDGGLPPFLLLDINSEIDDTNAEQAINVKGSITCFLRIKH